MKLSLKTTGQVELGPDDVLKIISEYLLKTANVTVTKLQRADNGKIVCIVEQEIDQGAKPMGAPVKPKIEKESNEGFSRRWLKFYESVGDIIDEQRKKKKTFISYSDLYALLIEFEDARGNKMFVRNGVPIEKWRFRQYLTKSQIKRQANLKGVKVATKDGEEGLSIG